jgi:hypothetical protein
MTSVPARAPVDELVRVEQDDPHHDRERHHRHAAKVPGEADAGPISGRVLSDP